MDGVEGIRGSYESCLFIRHSPDMLKFVEETFRLVGEHSTKNFIQTLA
jgi:hypothetical protein